MTTPKRLTADELTQFIEHSNELSHQQRIIVERDIQKRLLEHIQAVENDLNLTKTILDYLNEEDD